MPGMKDGHKIEKSQGKMIKKADSQDIASKTV